VYFSTRRAIIDVPQENSGESFSNTM
jgi:hypothetical protein